MDIYDKAIAHLTANPDDIYEAWACPSEHPSGALFAQRGGSTGQCLTQMKLAQSRPDYMPVDLFDDLRADSRIPKCGTQITLEDLPAFAEHQRALDDANVPLRVALAFEDDPEYDPWVKQHPMFPK